MLCMHFIHGSVGPKRKESTHKKRLRIAVERLQKSYRVEILDL